MKTDRVLTMEECLNQWCVVPMHANPPAKDARHVPVIAQEDIDLRLNVHGCWCDRWGHPCPDCVDKRNK
jgi:hypothetical protein